LLALCIGGLLLPTVAELLATRTQQTLVVERGVILSDFVAVLLLLGYVASILFSVFRLRDKGGAEEDLEPLVGARSAMAITRLLAYRHKIEHSSVPGKTDALKQIDKVVGTIAAPEAMPEKQEEKDEKKELKAPLWRSLLLLAIATVGVGVLSEILVSAIEPTAELLGWNSAFVGLIFVPLIGGLPEYFNTISMALDKRVGMVLAASAGSSIQIALLMAPILVLVSLFMPKRLDLVFSIIELAVLGLATFLFSEITKDGELVWLEGLLLMLLYAIMGGTVFIFGS
jgi:Ca2+:H+ antiporter